MRKAPRSPSDAPARRPLGLRGPFARLVRRRPPGTGRTLSCRPPHTKPLFFRERGEQCGRVAQAGGTSLPSLGLLCFPAQPRAQAYRGLAGGFSRRHLR